MFRSRFLLAAVVVALIAPAASQAAFTMTLNQTAGAAAPTVGNNTPFVITDLAGPITAPAAGTIFDSSGVIPTTSTNGFGQITLATSNGSSSLPNNGATFGAFFITFTGDRGSSASGSNVIGTTNSTIVSNSSSASATLVLTLTEDNFTLPTSLGVYNVKNTLAILSFTGSTVGALLSSASTVSDNPTGNTATISNSFTSSQINTPQTAAATTQWTRTASNYTVSHTVTLTLAASASINFQARTDVTPAPAPAGLIMLAGALPFAGLLRRRLRKSELATAA